VGHSTFSRDDYATRSSVRSAMAASTGRKLADVTFDYTDKIRTGAASGVHPSLSPKDLKVRESRDSDAHPVTVPIIIGLDTTGSMSRVPYQIQEALPKLMGHFIDDKVSGKKYLGEGYPAIMIAAVDDYNAMGGEGCLQIGQFESGIEIDDNLTNLWITHRGGGTYEEEYELLVYVAAYHTVHDHWEKRRRKGYLFLIGDEHAYDTLRMEVVQNILGTPIQSDMKFEDILRVAQERYHVFFVIPNMTCNYSDPSLERYWVNLLGQQNVLRLEDPTKICELIVGAVAICEEYVGIDDLTMDNLGMNALVPLSKTSSDLTRVDASGLVPVEGDAGGIERL